MASIGPIRLGLAENEDRATLHVTYDALGDGQDVRERRAYVETIELIGVDEGAGEDGQNETLGSPPFVDIFTFQSAIVSRSRMINLPSSLLDEDPARFPLRDEIRARVTLAPLGPAPVSRDSNIVARDDMLSPSFIISVIATL